MSFEDTLKQIVREVVREELSPAAKKQRLLTKDQAAIYMGCDIQTIDRMRAAGELGEVPLTGRGEKRAKPMFDVEDLDAWIEANKRRGNAA